MHTQTLCLPSGNPRTHKNPGECVGFVAVICLDLCMHLQIDGGVRVCAEENDKSEASLTQ